MKQGIVFKSLVIFSTLFISMNKVNADSMNNRLTIEPQKCVALRQGSVCYQSLRINWSTSTKGNYCLYLLNNHSPLKCWLNTTNGKAHVEFESNKNLTYLLKKQDSEEILSSTTIEVKWVYNKKRELRKGWRIF